jgi:hypothetical protein
MLSRGYSDWGSLPTIGRIIYLMNERRSRQRSKKAASGKGTGGRSLLVVGSASEVSKEKELMRDVEFAEGLLRIGSSNPLKRAALQRAMDELRDKLTRLRANRKISKSSSSTHAGLRRS